MKHSTTKDHSAAKTVGLYLPDWREYSPTEGTAYIRQKPDLGGITVCGQQASAEVHSNHYVISMFGLALGVAVCLFFPLGRRASPSSQLMVHSPVLSLTQGEIKLSVVHRYYCTLNVQCVVMYTLSGAHRQKPSNLPALWLFAPT